VPFSQTVNANIEWWGGAMREKFRDAAFTLACTRGLYDQMRRDYPEIDEARVGLCRMAVDVRKWVGVERRAAADGTLRVLSVGRLVASKGHDDLIRAVAIVRKRGHAIRLRIGGSGPEQEALMALVKELGVEDVVTFLGSLAEDRYQEEMNQADVFVLASHCEPLGVVYMEALATEAAVIGTAAGGVGELIKHEVNGLLVPPKNPEALAEGIERLLKDPELRRKLGEAGRRTVVAEFDSRMWAAELYRRLFGGLPERVGEKVLEKEVLVGVRG
jgi:colanic acid/amylovoran biosynthesis glycosyltransferase